MFQVGDKVWHINQFNCNNGKATKPFVVKDSLVYADGTCDYIVRCGPVHMLCNESQLVKVVK